jgi:outer membrane biosynthesis protein TonB
MDNTPVENRKWYKKKRYIVPLGVVGFFTILTAALSPAPTTTSVKSETQGLQAQQEQGGTVTLPGTLKPLEIEQQPEGAPTPTQQPTPSPVVQKIPPPVPSPTIAPVPSYYTNVDGDKVQSPTKADSKPSDASAKCKDGSYSFSKHRSGTCSGHGGVAVWY